MQQSEEHELNVSTAGCLLIGIVAVVFAMETSSDAILLDGLFNLTYFATGLFTVRVARLLSSGRDERFPFGYVFFEPLVNGLKGLLVLGVSTMAGFEAAQSILLGGRLIVVGPAVGYALFATTSCWFLAYRSSKAGIRLRSPLIQADAENWTVNAAISSAVLLAFLGILLLQDTRWNWLTPYVDPAVVLCVVLICLYLPIRMAWQALLQFLNRAPDTEVVERIRTLVEEGAADLPVKGTFIRVVRPGRTWIVLAHVLLPKDFSFGELASLDAYRSQIFRRIEQEFSPLSAEVLFTSDRQWEAPRSSVIS